MHAVQIQYHHQIDAIVDDQWDTGRLRDRLEPATDLDDPAYALRRVGYRDPETGKHYFFLTNAFELEAKMIADIYKERWQVELFFKWIKQYLRIKAFYGTSPNAVKIQIWIAICIYVLVAIAKKELKIERSLGEILQILSIALFEKVPISEVLTSDNLKTAIEAPYKQLRRSTFNRTVVGEYTQSDVWKRREPAEPRKDQESLVPDSSEVGPCCNDLPIP